MPASSVRLEGLRKRFSSGDPEAVRGVDLDVAPGEIAVLVGPSGCGKSTVLRLIAGLEAPTAGTIRIGERDVTELAPSARDVAMVFQSYALYPHRTVRENLAFGLRMRNVARAEIDARVAEWARRLGLGDVLDRRPAALSGGQRQRVALGRALVREPAVFLLDEPLSNLDARLRVETRAEIAKLHRELGATMLYVTHDQEEAMTLGDRIAVMRDGRVEQLAPPLEVYRRPATAFVAEFIGQPAISWFDARVEAGRLRGDGFELPAPAGLDAAGAVRLGVRPHQLETCTPERADVAGRVELVEETGHLRIAWIRPGTGDVFRVAVSAEIGIAVGDRIGVRFPQTETGLHLFDAVSGVRID